MKSDRFVTCNDIKPTRLALCTKISYICPEERCIPFTYVCDGTPHCKDAADEFCIKDQVRKAIAHNSFVCNNSGKIIDMKYVSDLFPDCEYGEDEESYFQTDEDQPRGRLFCQSGQNASFSYNDICQYDVYENGVPRYCRNGAHLEYCEHFNCSSVLHGLLVHVILVN